MTLLHSEATASNSRPLSSVALDPRLVFLARASARLALFEIGEMTLDEAVSGLLIEELDDGFEQLVELYAQSRPPPKPHCPRATPQVVVEAIMWCVRERGVIALQEAINQERLSPCDASARQQINDRIERLKVGRAP